MQAPHPGPSALDRAISPLVGAARRQARRFTRLRTGRRLSPAARFVHLFGAIAMLVGLFLPLTGVNQALASPLDTTPQQSLAQNAIPSGIGQVVAMGDFQSQLGCGDWDPNCGPSSLSNDGGIWSGIVGLAPGSYQVQFAVVDGTGSQFTFGSGGQDGGALGFSVSDGQAGAFFRFNAHTNAVQAEGIDALYTVQTDLGTYVPTPSGGTLDILVESQGGSASVQLLAAGAPVGEPQQAQLSPGWTRVSLDANGNVVNAQGLTYGTLTVQRLDADGNPAGGGCYQLWGGSLVNQACADGGGNAFMTFPEGIQPGGYTLVEVQAPSGQEPMADTQVDLQPGDQVVTLQPEAAEVIEEPTDEPVDEPTDEPTDEPIDEPVDDGFPSVFVVEITDDQGNPVPSACWQLIQDGNVIQEECDIAERGDTNPGNGRTGFDVVPPGTYTLHQSEGPDGGNFADDREITIPGDGSDVVEQITVEAAGQPTQEITEEPTQEEGIPSRFVVQLEDDQGNLIPNACWQLIQNDTVVEDCDTEELGDTNPGNGRTGFDDVPAGTYTLRQISGPEGTNLADDREITIPGDGGDVEEFVVVPFAEQPTGEVTEEPVDEPVTEEPTDEVIDDGFPSPLVVQITDDQGNPVPGACWQLIQGNDVVQEDCDREEWGDTNPGNGRTGFDSVPAGTYTLHQSEGPEGGAQAEDRQTTISGDGNPVEELITVPAGQQPTEEQTEEATEEPTEEPTEQPTDEADQLGNLQVDLYAPDGSLVGGACWQLVQDENVVAQACDIDDGVDRFPFNGKVGLYDVPVGAYTLRMSAVPDGYQQAPDTEVEITTTDGLLEATIQPSDAEPTEQPTEQQTEEPTEEATEEPTEQPTEEPTVPDGLPGALVVTLEDEQGNLIGGACFELVDADGNVVAESCDLPGPSDQNPNNGRSGFYGVPPGDYTVRQVGSVEGFEPVDPVSVTINPDAQTDETVVAQAAEGEPTEEPTDEPTEEPISEPTEEPTEPGETTGLIVDATGIDLAGQQLCIELGSTGLIGMSNPPFACDNGDNDQDPRDGIIVLADVPPGTYAFFVTSGPEELQDTEWPNVTIDEGQVTNVPLQSEPEAELGALRLTVVDDEGNQVQEEGTCVTVVGQTDSICDNEGGDASGEQGEILIENLPAGQYQITQDSAPEGFEPGQDLTDVPVDEGDETGENLGIFQATSDIQVIAVNDDGQIVGGACWAIYSSDAEVAAQCDDASNGGTPDDGFATFSGVPTGPFTLRLTQPPAGYGPVDDQPIEIAAGENEPVQVTLPSLPGSVVATITGDGEPLGDTCVGLVDLVTVCDNQDGDSDPTTGVIQINNVPPGQYQAAISNYPAGLDDPGFRDVEVLPDATANIEFALVASTGSVRAEITIGDEPVEGVCLGLVDLVTVCDNQDGDADPAPGAIQIDGVAPGDYQAAISNYPTGYDDPEIQPVTVDANEIAPLTWDLVELTGSVIANITADGEALEGACLGLVDLVTVCDNRDGDDNPDPGIIQIAGVPAGTYQAGINNYPAGYDAPGIQEVTVTAGADAPLTFALVSSTGSVSATVTNDESGEPIGGACLGIVDVTTVCDNQAGDMNPDTGVIQIDGLAPGDYQAAINNYPAGFDDPGIRDLTIEANEIAELDFDLVPSPPEVADLRMLVQTADASPVAGGCVVLSQENVVAVGPVCDNQAGDADAADGVILLEDVPVGSYSASLTPESTAGIPGYQSSDEPSVTVAVGSDNQGVIVVVVDSTPATGSLELIIRNNVTSQRLGGACFEVSGAVVIVICDNGAGDLNPQAGVIQLVDVPAGEYTLGMTTTPEGYTPAADRTVDVESGGDSSYEIRIDPLPDESTLTVFKVNPDDEPLGNSCFALRQGSTTIASQCDSTDANPNDGTLVFNDVPAGTYMLVETRSPANGYSLASPVSVTIVAGVDKDVTVINYPKPGRVIVTKVNANDATDILPNACFALEGDRNYGPFCDGDDGVTDGRVIFANVVAGDYTLVETSPPPGFIASGDQDFTLAPGATRNFTVANQPAPPPAETGDLVITKVNTDGERLAGSCFRLFDGNSALTAQICDGADGANDGIITFSDVPAGTWTLRETVTPSTSYQFAELRDVTIENNEVTRVTVENTLKPGRLQVNKTNTDGRPLQGACFDLREDEGGVRCTDAYGVVIFGNLEPGSYTLVETQAPYGYQPAADVTGIQVNPGQTRVVNVTNSLIPPPANTGSVQVQKFFCPAGEAGEGTSFFGGAQGSRQLARTAGCERGNASFTLVGDNGSGGPGAFQTGSDGQYQVTLTEGIYRLTETDPVLEENPTVRVRVNRGQMTTVIVINYVAPPEPDPITVNVAKYTCTPSFNGTRYEDFMESCAEDEQLTNTITIRLQGPVTAKGVTGDGGERGRTTFTGLTPGAYTIFEERPHGIPTDYLFCGFQNSAESQWKAVNGSLTINLDYGQTLTCTFHNIPEVLTEDTGTILVRKFVCEIKNPPKGYDWEEECGLSHQNASFSLARYDAESQEYGEPVIAQANPDGFVRFTHLQPGSYQLREVDGAWCHAESNSVNAQGDVVVTANKLSEVWIYNCVEPTEPPNTGSGDAATNPPPADPVIGGEGNGEGPAELPSVVAFPLLAAAAWYANRRRAA